MELLVDTSTRLVLGDRSFELSSNLSTEILPKEMTQVKPKF